MRPEKLDASIRIPQGLPIGTGSRTRLRARMRRMPGESKQPEDNTRAMAEAVRVVDEP